MSHENNGKSDEWYTPKFIFDKLECIFDLDAASPIDRKYCSVPATNFITENSLKKIWMGFVWLNPPFEGRNDKEKWLEKMYNHGNGIALTPDRSSTDWWQCAAKKCDGLLMVKKKIQFIKPDGTIGKSPSNGTTLFAYGQKGINTILKAEKNGLGIALFNK